MSLANLKSLSETIKNLFKSDLNDNSNSSKLLKIALISGSTIGIILISRQMIKYYYYNDKVLPDAIVKQQNKTPFNGNLLTNNDITDFNEVTINKQYAQPTEQRTQPFINRSIDSEFPSLLEDIPEQTVLNRSRTASLSNRHLSRKRFDSTTSISTLIVSSRSPSELLMYGIETLRRAIKLLEESKNRIQARNQKEGSTESELEFILSKGKQLIDDVEDYRKEITPEKEIEEEDFDDNNFDDNRSLISSCDGTFSSSASLIYFDVEPNIHFFKLYTEALENVEELIPPRVNRSQLMYCESEAEFIAKVHCLRVVFASIFAEEENCKLFIDIGRDILKILLSHSLQDPTDCLIAYNDLLNMIMNTENHSLIEEEIGTRSITCLSFYDIVIDYIILDSFEDLDDPPSAVLSVANNRWLSSGFKELALQTAVSAVLRHKRSRLVNSDGFFAHFYNILDYISPIFAWGFLGTDYDLKFKCNLIKDSLLDLIRDYFSFDRVRYTSNKDLIEDILRLTNEAYDRLQERLQVK